MNHFRPYDIMHCNLYEVEDLQLPQRNNNGKYIVIWYKEVPLGDFYIGPGIAFGEKEYRTNIASAISDTIKFYQDKDNEVAVDWKSWLLNHNLGDWKNELGEVLKQLIAKEIPDTVPVSIIICTRNRSESLSACLESLKKLICQPEEIIIVDNAPSDLSTFHVVEKFENVIYVKEPQVGLSIARNTGIKNSNAPIIAFTDDDVQTHPLWIYRLWKSFTDKKIVAVTGLVITSRLETEAQYIFEKYWSFNRGFVEKIYDTAYFEATLKQGPPVWQIGAGANMAFRRSVFRELGYFNEFLGAGASGCSEDSEMWFRILSKGYTIKYDPKAITFHEHRKEMNLLKKQIFSYMRGFTVAALIQQRQYPTAAYKRHLFIRLPQYYSSLITKGFPFYRNQFQTLGFEMKGILSGLRYYYKNFPGLINSMRK